MADLRRSAFTSERQIFSESVGHTHLARMTFAISKRTVGGPSGWSLTADRVYLAQRKCHPYKCYIISH